MSSDWLLVVHLFYEPGRKPATNTVIDWLFDRGCRTEEGGGNETCHYYVDGMDWPESNVPTERALAELTENAGYLRLWSDGVRFDFEDWEQYAHVPDLPYYTFSVPEAQLVPVESVEEGRKKAQRIVDLVADFADETGAVYGFGRTAAGDHQSHCQDADDLCDGDIDRIFWFNYLSELIASRIGRERLLTAPAEHVEERRGGAVLVVPYLNPRQRDRRTRRATIEDHLGI